MNIIKLDHGGYELRYAGEYIGRFLFIADALRYARIVRMTGRTR